VASRNIVTPRWRLLYNNGRNFLFNLHKGPIQSITCNISIAKVEVDLINTVSKVYCALNIAVSTTKLLR
jgi:hypothetical protein